jgi:integrase
MLPATASVPATDPRVVEPRVVEPRVVEPRVVEPRVVEPRVAVLVAYGQHLSGRGRGNTAYDSAARSFLDRWPDPQLWARRSLATRLGASTSLRPFLTFLMVTGRLAPGYDYLVRRKLSSIWVVLSGTPMDGELGVFIAGAQRLGFSRRVASGMGSQVVARLLIQTGKPLHKLTITDLEDLAGACRSRFTDEGVGWHHYRGAIHATRNVLFHEGIVDSLSPPCLVPVLMEERMRTVSDVLRPTFVNYLERKSVTCKPKTITTLATRLAWFGGFLATTDPALTSLHELDRQDHIEPFLIATTRVRNTATGQPITVADQARRILAVSNFLTEITEWGWVQAPPRRLLFRTDIPRQPRPLPRYLPTDADRALTEQLASSPNRMPADALLLQRACGLRIGELLDLEADCMHDTPSHGSWLKIPLGKLDTERMVPIDEETLALLDRITTTRSTGRPINHPRTGRPAQFLFTHHGRRLSQTALRNELTRAAAAAGIAHVTPHQLRHTYATTMVNAGVSIQALMTLLGHSSAQMTLRYAHLFDHTIRQEYERALDLARARIGGLPARQATSNQPELGAGQPWTELPLIATALAVGHCLRAPAQGPCPHANICHHCPSLRLEPSDVITLQTQRADTIKLVATADKLGWTTEADRHTKLLARLDALITTTEKP